MKLPFLFGKGKHENNGAAISLNLEDYTLSFRSNSSDKGVVQSFFRSKVFKITLVSFSALFVIMATVFYFSSNDDNTFKKALSLYRDNRLVDAFILAKPLADLGHVNSQFLVVQEYQKGISQDREETNNWYRKSAEQGNSRAQIILGEINYGGYVVQKDDRDAVKSYRMYEEQDKSEGIYHMCLCYRDGIGLKKDGKEEIKRWEKSEALDHVFKKEDWKSDFQDWLG